MLDTNAKAKSDAKFTDIKTGNTELDKVLDKAISLGKSQQTSTSSSSSSQTSSSSSSQASSNTTSEPKPSSSNETRSSRSEVNMGLSSAGLLFKEVPVVLPIISLLLMIVITLPGILRMVSWNKF